MRVEFSDLVTKHNKADSVLKLRDDMLCKLIKETTVEIYVPRGFETDLASVPKWLGSIYPRHGRYTYAAVLHDYLYKTKMCKRARADYIFREAMRSCNVRLHTRWLFWLFVRAFGWRFYG